MNNIFKKDLNLMNIDDIKEGCSPSFQPVLFYFLDFLQADKKAPLNTVQTSPNPFASHIFEYLNPNGSNKIVKEGEEVKWEEVDILFTNNAEYVKKQFKEASSPKLIIGNFKETEFEELKGIFRFNNTQNYLSPATYILSNFLSLDDFFNNVNPPIYNNYRRFYNLADITVGIPTRNRPFSLINCLWSILYQTKKPSCIHIVDTSDAKIDWVRDQTFIGFSMQQIIKTATNYGIKIKIQTGQAQPQRQVHSHKEVIKSANTEFIFRLDDDIVLDNNCIEELDKNMIGGTVAVAPLIFQQGQEISTKYASSDIEYITSPMANLQWTNNLKEKTKVEHLYSSFLHRNLKDCEKMYDEEAIFREETIFSYNLSKEGALFIVPSAKCSHFSCPTRTNLNKEHYEKGDAALLKSLKIPPKKVNIVPCFGALGDNYVVKTLFTTEFDLSLADEWHVFTPYPSSWQDLASDKVKIYHARECTLPVFAINSPFNLYKEKASILENARKVFANYLKKENNEVK